MATATVSYKAELADLRAKLASIPEITATEARKAVSTLNKSMKAVERTQKRAVRASRNFTATTETATKTTRQLGHAARSTAQQIPDVISQLSSGTPVLQTLTQQGLQVVQVNMGLLGAAASAAALPLAALTTTVTAGYLAWRVYSDDQRRAEAITERVMALHEAQKPILDAIKQSTLDLAVATGQLTEAEAQQERAAESAHSAYQEATKETRARLAELGEGQEGVWTQMVGLAEKVTPAWTPLGAVIRATTTSAEDMKEESEQLNVALVDTINLTARQSNTMQRVIGVTEENAEATRRLAKAKREAAKADRDAEREAERAAKEATAAVEQLTSIRDAALMRQLTGADRINEALRRQLGTIGELESASGDIMAAEDARVAVTIEAERELAEFRAGVDAERMARSAALAAQEEAAAAAARARTVAAVSSLGDLAGATSDMFALAAQNQSEAQAEQAARLFKFSQAAGIGEAAIQGAIGVVKAFAQLGPIAGIPAAAAVTGVTAAQIATIASQSPPSFDIGGPIRAGVSASTPDQIPIRVLPGEGIVSRGGMSALGESGLNEVNRGRAPRPQIAVVQAYQHWGRFSADATTQPGALSRALAQDTRVGALGW